MVNKIIWTKTASRTFDKIANYLVDEASLAAAQNFASEIYDKIDYIVKYPFVGRSVKGTKSLKMLNVAKRYHLYFRVQGKTLFISDFFDSRQDPNKRPH